MAARAAVAAALAVGALMLAGCGGGGGSSDTSTTAACVSASPHPGTVLLYRLEPGTGPVTGAARKRTIAIICRRLAGIGVEGAKVVRHGEDEISVSLPKGSGVSETAAQVGAGGQLFFYDWEPSLIGPEFTIGGHPGHEPPPKALKESKERWKEAGRASDQETEQLIFAGAYPNAYGAVQLAAEQESAGDCSSCSAPQPRFYLFSKDSQHDLLAGPVTSKADLYAGPSGIEPGEGQVLRVPAGTVVVSELPQEEGGVPIEGAEPGWYALKDEPALTGAEIINPEAKNQNGLAVVFEFTGSGRKKFRDVTRRIAERGKEGAIGLVDEENAEVLSGHFAVVLDNEVKTRPIINFQENPDGIDGRTGAQLSGGFITISDAQQLAKTLRIGAPPVQLVLVRRSSAG
jgi:SecD/SecF fusion protein